MNSLPNASRPQYAHILNREESEDISYTPRKIYNSIILNYPIIKYHIVSSTVSVCFGRSYKRWRMSFYDICLSLSLSLSLFSHRYFIVTTYHRATQNLAVSVLLYSIVSNYLLRLMLPSVRHFLFGVLCGEREERRDRERMIYRHPADVYRILLCMCHPLGDHSWIAL